MNVSSISKYFIIIILISSLSLKAQVHDFLQEDVQTIIKTLFQFQPEKALDLVDQSKELDTNSKTFFQAWCFHQMGRYQDVLTNLEKLDSHDLPADPMIQNRYEEMKATAKELVHFKTLDTPHFKIHYQEGKDEVLTFFLPDVLESFYAYYTRFFGIEFSKPILVEVMPTHELFSYACALTKKQIETTGTVALCVENRLAMITPRRVLTGYDWAHVLSHEFIHFILTRKTKNHAPLWFQEGVAKAFENHWDTKDPQALEPALAHNLAMGLKEDRLVTFEEMHPSFAALPTPELAGRAYAQVASMVDYLSSTKGEKIIPDLSAELATTKDLNSLIANKLGMSFDDFLKAWKSWAKKQNYKILPHMEYHPTQLLDEDGGGESLSTTKNQNDNERKFRRLGDLLLEQKRFMAALIEFDKAQAFRRIDKPDTILDRQFVLRFLKCYQALGLYQKIPPLIEKNIFEPEKDATMLQFVAEAEWHQNQPSLALKKLNAASRINPYDPNIYNLQMDIASDQKNQELKSQAEKILAILTTK